jgi:cell division protein ZapA (FtsZ GTPase activity inhibitor)
MESNIIKLTIADKEYTLKNVNPAEESLLLSAATLINKRFEAMGLSKDDALAITAFDLAVDLLKIQKGAQMAEEYISRIEYMLDLQK